MKKVKRKAIRFILALGLALPVFGTQQVFAGPLPGAIFTTLEDGSRVNHNIYEQMEDVYLDGGPGQNAPSWAAGLPEGDYYFQVTDPSGKVLLSEDPVKCRRFYVNEYGVIADVCEATCLQKLKGKGKGRGGAVEADCTHLTGVDVDHSDVGAITVQLMPYEKTPNKGGVYKVWVTPVERFVGNPELIDNPDFFHGFVPAWSKTDNYKVRRGPPPPVIRVRKFLDANANGIWDMDPCEAEIYDDWWVDVTSPDFVTNRYYMPWDFLAAPEGLYTLTEETRSGWLQTALIVDGVPKPPEQVEPTAQIDVQASDVLREVIFGNIPLGSITACKFDDADANGIWDEGEPCVPGFPFHLEGENVRGDVCDMADVTGENGCVTFTGLLPGVYTVSEVLPYEDWVPTTDPCVILVLPDGAEYDLLVEFGNIRLGSITACKFYDADDSSDNDGEPCVPGIRFELEGDDVRGTHIYETNCTGPDGCVTFEDLYPGNYTLTEFLPSENWVPTTPISVELNLPEGEDLIRKFGNYCLIPSTADFDTKGYWHNKNGIDELTNTPDVDFVSVLEDVNSLAPYAGPSGYFSKGDEPFDGKYENGSPVPAGKGVLENEDIAGEGTVEAEISSFLINSVGDGGTREQLAQQLLAFIFNAYYRIGDGLDTMILLPDTTPVSISELISCAVSVWSGVPDPDCTLNLNVNEMATLLDWFNNNDAVKYMTVSPVPCEFVSMCD